MFSRMLIEETLLRLEDSSRRPSGQVLDARYRAADCGECCQAAGVAQLAESCVCVYVCAKALGPSTWTKRPLWLVLASTDLHQRQIRVRGIQRLGDDGSNSRCRGRKCRGGHLSRYNEIGRSLHRRLGGRCVLRWQGLPVRS